MYLISTFIAQCWAVFLPMGLKETTSHPAANETQSCNAVRDVFDVLIKQFSRPEMCREITVARQQDDRITKVS